jgi:hypothetical protein
VRYKNDLIETKYNYISITTYDQLLQKPTSAKSTQKLIIDGNALLPS